MATKFYGLTIVHQVVIIFVKSLKTGQENKRVGNFNAKKRKINQCHRSALPVGCHILFTNEYKRCLEGPPIPGRQT